VSNKEFRVKLSVDDGELNTGFARADQRAAAFAKSVADAMASGSSRLGTEVARYSASTTSGLQVVGKRMGDVAANTKLTSQEMMALNYTASDVAASLASGASPFTILLQQGGQLKDSFGGFGPLFQKLGSFVTVANVGLAALAATAGTVAAAVLAGMKEQDAYNKAILLTGNYAGLTNDRVAEMAAALADSVGVTQAASREMVVALAATGRVGRDELDSVAAAALRFQKATGRTAEDVAGYFAGMQDGVTAWATAADKSYHFLSAAQLDHIKRLEEEGKTSEAMRVASEALYKHLGGDAVKNLGYLEQGWDAVTSAVGRAWEGMKALGREQTNAQKIAGLQAQILANEQRIAEARDNARGAGMFGTDGSDKVIKAAQARIDAAKQELQGMERLRLEEQAGANTRAARAGMEDRAKVAQLAIDKLNEQADKQGALNKALAEYRRQVADLAAVGRAPSAAEQATQEAAIRDRFKDTKARAAQNQTTNAVRDKLNSLGGEDASLRQQIAQFDQYGRAVDSTTRSVIDFELTQGKLKSASAAAAQELRALADSVDSQKLKLAQLKEAERLDNRVERLRASAAAQALSNREARVAQELAAIDEKTLPKGSALYEQKAAAIRAAVNAAEDQLTVQRLAAASRQVDDDIARLDEETQMLTRNSLQRQIATYALRLEAQARKEAANSPDMVGTIEADRYEKLQRYSTAATFSYNRQRMALSGIEAAAVRYVEETENSAAAAGRMFERTVGGMEDALTSLLTNGKADVKQLVNTMLAEFNRLYVVRPLLAQLAGGGAAGGGVNVAGLIASGIGSIFGASLGTGTTAALASAAPGDALDNFLAFNNNFAGARAGGGSVEPGADYLVGELGPERFRPAVAGTIVPNSALKAGGPAVQVVQHFTVAAGASRVEMAAMAARGRDEAVQTIARMIKQGQL
jgi:phage-related minor tail protein